MATTDKVKHYLFSCFRARAELNQVETHGRPSATRGEIANSRRQRDNLLNLSRRVSFGSKQNKLPPSGFLAPAESYRRSLARAHRAYSVKVATSLGSLRRV